MPDMSSQAGYHHLSWDGRSSSGVPVTLGLYLRLIRIMSSSAWQVV
ncbi:hypothetical protein ISS30_06730 [bacterium]|nr:hypothetical protein [bacterium]